MQTAIGNWHLYKYIDVAGRSRYVNNQLFFSKLLLDTWAEGGKIYKIVFLQFLPSPHCMLIVPQKQVSKVCTYILQSSPSHIHVTPLCSVHKKLVTCFGREKKKTLLIFWVRRCSVFSTSSISPSSSKGKSRETHIPRTDPARRAITSLLKLRHNV